MKKGMIVLAAFVICVLCAQQGWASSAAFTIAGENIEESDRPGVYRVTIQVGKPLEIRAQGFVYSLRVAPSSPEEREEAMQGAPRRGEAGTWMFDETKFRLRRTNIDSTQHILVVEPTTPGTHEIRFVGVILGYPNSLTIQVNVQPRQAE
ncbi:MAG: hypothetical protein ACNA71_09880 [Kiritimatiellia bacterium]